ERPGIARRTIGPELLPRRGGWGWRYRRRWLSGRRQGRRHRHGWRWIHGVARRWLLGRAATVGRTRWDGRGDRTDRRRCDQARRRRHRTWYRFRGTGHLRNQNRAPH